MQTKVTFIYDESHGKWEVIVTGVESHIEALQAFNAVVMTARDATPNINCNKAEILEVGSYKISVGQ